MNSFNHVVTDLPEQESASPPALALVFPASAASPGIAPGLVPLASRLGVSLYRLCARLSEVPHVLGLLRRRARDLPALGATRICLLARSLAVRPCAPP
jgi:hypothetical protein